MAVTIRPRRPVRYARREFRHPGTGARQVLLFVATDDGEYRVRHDGQDFDLPQIYRLYSRCGARRVWRVLQLRIELAGYIREQ